MERRNLPLVQTKDNSEAAHLEASTGDDQNKLKDVDRPKKVKDKATSNRHVLASPLVTKTPWTPLLPCERPPMRRKRKSTNGRVNASSAANKDILLASAPPKGIDKLQTTAWLKWKTTSRIMAFRMSDMTLRL